MALTTVAALNVSASIVNALNLGGNTANLASTFGLSLTDGTAAGQANTAFWDHRTITASSNEDLDLAGVLSSPLNQTVTLARIKLLVVSADASNANNVVVGAAASNALAGLFGATTHTAIVRPGCTLCWMTGSADATGYAVTAGTGDLLRIANSGAGTSVSYSIVVIGANA